MDWQSFAPYLEKVLACLLTLKVPITTAADDKFWDIFPNFWLK